MPEPLNEHEEAVLHEIDNAIRQSDQLGGHYKPKAELKGDFEASVLDASLNALSERGYIKDIKVALARIGDTSLGYEAYQLTPQGKLYLRKMGNGANIQHNSFGDISDSAINVGTGSPHQTATKHNPPAEPSAPQAPKQEHKWFWWAMTIVGGLIILLIGAYVFGIGD